MNDRPVALLEQILGTKSKVTVLRALFRSKLGYSGGTLARSTGTGLLAVQKTLAALEHAGLVKVERGSTENRYRLNVQHYLVTNGLRALFEGEQRMSKALAQDLRVLLEGKVLTAGLFGSFARGTPRVGSDIDVLVVVRNSKERDHISDVLTDAETKLTEKYGWPVQAAIFELRRLLDPHTNGPALLEEAARDWQHVVGLAPAELKKSIGATPRSRRKS